MGLLNDLETQLEQEIAAQLQESLQQALNDFRSECTDLNWNAIRGAPQVDTLTRPLHN